jgi:hypothetical protein
LIELFAAFQGGATGVRAFAHLGGMFFGYAYVRWGSQIDLRAGRLWHGIHAPFNRKRAPLLEEVTDDLVHKVDRILEKVSKQGADALSAKEKEILERYTRSRHA